MRSNAQAIGPESAFIPASPQATLARTLAAALSDAVGELAQDPARYGELSAPTLEPTSKLEHGDYASNAAMLLARHLRRSPIEIAQELAPLVERSSLVRRAEAAPPGFLNLFVDWREWGARRGHGDFSGTEPSRSTVKILIEHTSINPNKAAHIGHLRNSTIGDTVARLLARVGYTTEVHNYVDDLGVQVADSVVGLLRVPFEGGHRRLGDFLWDLYALVRARGESDPELAAETAYVLQHLERGHNTTSWVGRLMADRIVAEQEECLAEFAVRHEVFVRESDIVREGLWEQTFKRLQDSPIFQLETEGPLRGCWALKRPRVAAALEDVNSDKVLVKSDGSLTYTAKDIAYHLWKFGELADPFRYTRMPESGWTTSEDGERRDFGRAQVALNVIDRRQEYPQEMVRLALEALGFEDAAANLHHVRYAVVSLSPPTAERLGVDTSANRSSYPMSGREAIGIKASNFLDQMEAAVEESRPRDVGLTSREIAAAAIRYYLLRFNLDTEVVFDLDRAADLQGNTGVYLMYQHARAAKIIDEVRDVSPSAGAPEFDPDRLQPAELALLRQVAKWADVLEEAAHDFNPTAVASYAFELAARFSRFYDRHPVLKAPPRERYTRLWLTAVSREALAEALDILGIPAPEEM